MNDRLKVIVEDAAELARTDQEAFSMIRRVGFGASDSSIILGVNPFPDGTIEKLLAQKRTQYVTPEERAIGQMVNVRKGVDLEPIIMRKFQEAYDIPEERIQKPPAMYRIDDSPLTVNYDGVLQVPPFQVPVECKFVSTYGGKYYDTTKAMGSSLSMGIDIKDLGDEVNEMYLAARSKEAGIPIYYYTQIQQQLFGLNAEFGYLAALFDKDWELKTFLVMADPKVQARLRVLAEVYWNQI